MNINKNVWTWMTQNWAINFWTTHLPPFPKVSAKRRPKTQDPKRMIQYSINFKSINTKETALFALSDAKRYEKDMGSSFCSLPHVKLKRVFTEISLVEEEVFIYSTISSLILRPICAPQTRPNLILFLLKLYSHMGKNCWYSLSAPSRNLHEFLKSFQLLLDRVTSQEQQNVI